MEYVEGQRWASLMEPELGIGIITKIEGTRLHLLFSESKVTRVYSLVSAPVKRVSFNIGDNLKDNKGKSIVIKKIEEEKGILVYHGEDSYIKECDISDLMSFNSPVERLFAGKFDKSNIFNIRYHSMLLKSRILKSNVHGFIGGKIDLLPHQLYIANEASKRVSLRVLLSDEVGLGKTIEASLILHNLIITGKISRVLILTPESLVYQWFSELFYRFNLIFRIITNKYCDSFKNTNPFLDGTLSITSINLISDNQKYQNAVLESDWDMIIIDEAHNIKEDTELFSLISDLTKKTKHVLFLTATPDILGLESHFARLKLLDPDRYFDYDEFLKEINGYKNISELTESLINDKKLSDDDNKRLAGFLGTDYFDFFRPKELVIKDLLDRHGIGRVMFRNTRKTIKNFPKRVAKIIETDNKINSLSKLLTENRKEKFLLICHSKETVLEIGNALKKRGNFKISFFHEDLSVIDRDKNASWFSLPEGSQILICSEIGSEGRNFQFVNNLILFELPANPEILEQRIGRLDRIGQKKTIDIYLPYVRGEKDEILLRWYHFGLNAFEENIPDGEIIFAKYGKKLDTLMERCDTDRNIIELELEKIILDTKNVHKRNIKILEEGKDRLLELNSFNHERAEEILSEIKEWEEDEEIEDYMHEVFDYFGIEENPIGDRSYILTPGNVKTDAFPKIDQDGVIVSYNRKKSLSHEKILFLNPDHPYVNRSIDLILGGDHGNASIGIWYSKERENIFVESLFVLECIAPPSLHINRFLPPTPVRVVLDRELKDYSEEYPFDFFETYLKDDSLTANNFLKGNTLILNQLRGIIEKAQLNALAQTCKIIEGAVKEMRNLLEEERARLVYLKRINPGVKEYEIREISEQILELERYMKEARLRFDSVRIVVKKRVDN